MHSLGIVQWNFTRQDHPRNPGRVSGSGLVILSLVMGSEVNDSRPVGSGH